MNFDYFYEEQSESYAFYKIPKVLFTEEMFEPLSTDAKVLYGLLLDRVSLSKMNSWIDETGKVYIYFTVKNVKASMRCANTKACALLKELQDFGLIERYKQGLGKPAKIYVKDFTRFRKSEVSTSENRNSGDSQIRIIDCRKSESINTESNNNEFNKTHSILSDEEEERRAFDWLMESYPYDRAMITEIFDLIVDTVCSKKDTIRVAGDNKPSSVVKSQLMKLSLSPKLSQRPWPRWQSLSRRRFRFWTRSSSSHRQGTTRSPSICRRATCSRRRRSSGS